MSEQGGRQSRFRKRKSRWSEEVNTHIMSSVSAIPKYIPGGLTTEQIEALQVRVRMEELTRKLNLNELDIDYTEARSPSPEPIYDQQGKRVNTKEQRAREKLLMERHGLVQMATAMWPQFRPPSDYQPVANKKMRKIMIPVEKHPEYNFIGLIIGPRGNTQKRMERETGTKISIRGKGSIKEGKGKRDAKSEPDANEPLHVLLTADTEAQLEKATKMITDLLVPVEEGRNEHKRQQLRELAEINGTLRDRSWMQPTSERTWEPAKVKCQICGEISHPTSDCPLKGKGFAALPTEKQESLASEFDKFMSEIGEAPAPPKDAYDEFMASIGESKSEPKTDAPPPWAQPQNFGAVPPPWQQPGPPAPAPWETQQPVPPMYPPPDPTMQPWQYPQSMYWNQPPPEQ